VNFGEFGPGGLPLDFAYLDAHSDNPPVTVVVAPKASIRLSDFRISFGTLERIQRGETTGYMWGWVEYDDVFDDTPRRRTEYCFRIARVTPPISNVTIEWRAHHQHNGMDEECQPDRWQTTKGGVFIEPRRPQLPPSHRGHAGG
jgi:hypothetical protein